MVCANHPSSPPDKNNCLDYRETVTLSVTTSEDITFQSIIKSLVFWTFLASFFSITWFALTSLSLASLRYSWRHLTQNVASESSGFLSDFHFASTKVFWTTVCLGSGAALIIFVIGGLVLIIAIPSFVTYILKKEGSGFL
ncbi:MAG: hypothetical protein HC763_26070 [Hydrococcus sp. CRU_1_1]|nr:hypothetical protein [Hydrococcus sp. CRU_1_1]